MLAKLCCPPDYPALAKLAVEYPQPSDPDHPSQVLLCLDDQQRLVLRQSGPKAPGDVLVDFVGGSQGHRRKFGGGKSQQVAKACGLHKKKDPLILDATAGLGRDGFVLANIGAHVILLERHPSVAVILQDGLDRAAACIETAEIVSRICLYHGSLLDAQLPEFEQPDIVYLDPMFPERKKKAAVKKEMVLFHSLVGCDEDSDQLLKPALALAKKRVVVKRPTHAPWLDNQKPSLELTGKSCRFDIYFTAE
ncbi:class I SAM-dependent methyltransferase [Pelagibaculum spongiae]|uniref:class I SAM-dependent methyltransferase n=1 Tax=Pelagibaculum spongiae TaxID=2080658 RepID=UPI00131441E1|nr:class I SAM-dependent methyltransferase [Pelagibaculum spongiae]